MPSCMPSPSAYHHVPPLSPLLFLSGPSNACPTQQSSKTPPRFSCSRQPLSIMQVLRPSRRCAAAPHAQQQPARHAPASLAPLRASAQGRCRRRAAAAASIRAQAPPAGAAAVAPPPLPPTPAAPPAATANSTAARAAAVAASTAQSITPHNDSARCAVRAAHRSCFSMLLTCRLASAGYVSACPAPYVAACLPHMRLYAHNTSPPANTMTPRLLHVAVAFAATGRPRTAAGVDVGLQPEAPAGQPRQRAGAAVGGAPPAGLLWVGGRARRHGRRRLPG